MYVLTTVTLANSSSALPDDGDYTETYGSCFNVYFNIPLKKNLCISWCKNFDNIRMHGTTVKRKGMKLYFCGLAKGNVRAVALATEVNHTRHRRYSRMTLTLFV